MLKNLFRKIAERKRIKKSTQLLASIYQDIDTMNASAQERIRLNLEEDAYIYGEINFTSFYYILQITQPKAQEVFYDLGSGAGKAVFSAALYFDFSKACGIEFLPGLSKLATNTLQLTSEKLALKIDDFHQTCLSKLISIQFINGDFLTVDFTDGDIVFIHATCFHALIWEKIVDALTQLKPGSRVIVATKKIQHADFQLISAIQEKMSWGMSFIHIYKKI